jgi:hypothetical protein
LATRLNMYAEKFTRTDWRTFGVSQTARLAELYVSVEPFHLFRYLDEQSFRFNNRGHRKAPITDADRFKMVVAGIVGKRLTYSHLTGKDDARQEQPF